MRTNSVLIGLGANVAGAWGTPGETVKRALDVLQGHSEGAFQSSPLYATAPVGPANQPDYINAVCELETALAPAGLLSLFKHIEREAGRGKGRRWGPRALDLDLLDY
ncbi:MAG: 2-amino-4-hydroxy-6-hydroxymethyldihydropteridine diphosphokinase, partial [Hyphomicrobiaceae bacterium]